MTKKTVVNLIIDLIFAILLVISDQYTKAWAVVNLKDKPAIPIIPGILELNYLENKGAAFGGNPCLHSLYTDQGSLYPKICDPSHSAFSYRRWGCRQYDRQGFS